MNNPCRRICRFDGDKICIGCGMSSEEVRNWRMYNEEEKKVVMDRLRGYKSEIKSRFEE